jgi:glycosyltransferase involved in cell wall biosynthesis
MTGSVLVYSRSTPHHHTGGMETLAWSLAAEWARMIPEVRVVTTAIPAADGPFVEDGVTVVPLAGTAAGRYSGAWWSESLRHWQSLPAGPDAVLSVSAGAYSIVKARAPHTGTAFVMQAHGTSMMEIDSKLRVHDLRSLAGAAKNALGLPRDLIRYRDFDRIVAVGERVVESLGGAPMRWSTGEKVRLIPNGVRAADARFDPQARAKVRAGLGIDSDVVVVGSIGRLHVQKGLDRALHAAAVLRDRGAADRFHFMLVGDGPDEGRLRGLVAQLGIERLVTFAGPVEHRDVRAHWSAADIALLSTARVEGLPMSVLEALACGLPTVVTAGSVGSRALASVLHEVDSATPETLAAALQGTALNVRRATLLPSAFELETCARDYLSVFAEAAAQRRG